jgi:hypothetical protein
MPHYSTVEDPSNFEGCRGRGQGVESDEAATDGRRLDDFFISSIQQSSNTHNGELTKVVIKVYIVVEAKCTVTKTELPRGNRRRTTYNHIFQYDEIIGTFHYTYLYK